MIGVKFCILAVVLIGITVGIPNDDEIESKRVITFDDINGL